jgi:integrase
VERWLDRWVLRLGDLDRTLLADVDRRLGIGDRGQPHAASVAGRYRKLSKACIRRAVELGRLDVDPWPPAPRGRNRRKALRKRSAVDVKRLPDPQGMASIIQAIRTHQPGSRKYQVMTSISYYAGLRPSEVIMLRPRALDLPAEGWGVIDVREADIGFDEPGEPKTGQRSVLIPPALVEMLRSWIEEHELASDALLFRTRTGRRPAATNWNRSLQRACARMGFPSMRVYDARHACATAWLGAGLPLGEVARWLGHSVETLVTVYVGALEGDDDQAKRKLEERFTESWSWMSTAGPG